MTTKVLQSTNQTKTYSQIQLKNFIQNNINNLSYQTDYQFDYVKKD